eukprot:GFUD01080304.1.p1 GENE.GFUD01080304.1~~GFUD01080304.1.p1  ORF type:complete len:173 (+),score=35.67 GFUD01080304.1:49-519(+)
MTVGMPKLEDDVLIFEVNEKGYKHCRNGVNLHLSCTSEDGTSETFEITGLTVERSKIRRMRCRAKAYKQEELSDCFTDTGSPCNTINWALVIGPASAGLLLVVLCIAICCVCRVRKSQREELQEMNSRAAGSVIIPRRDETYENTKMDDEIYYSHV